MSGWRESEWLDPEGEAIYRYLVLDSDAGKRLGSIMQFCEGAAYYPQSMEGRLGPHTTLDGAMKAVERVAEVGFEAWNKEAWPKEKRVR